MNGRLSFLSYCVLFSAILIVAQLFRLQVIYGGEYREKAENRLINSVETLNRHDIFFTKKNGERISAATNKIGYIVKIDPSIIKNPEDIYNTLSQYFEIDENIFVEKSDKKNSQGEILAKRLDYNKGQEIMKLNLKGVSLELEKWRFYPANALASRTIGFMAYNKDQLQGQYGLERFYEKTLAYEGKKVSNSFFVDIFLGLGKLIQSGLDTHGSLVTTIEPQVQARLEEEINAVHSDYNAKLTGGIIMDPKTGAIYGMAISPAFNLNEFNKVENVEIFNNPLVENFYEMGSIIKPLTMASGIDARVVTPDTTYEDKGSLTLDGRTFYNHDKKVRGVVDMQTVLDKSLNTGASFVVSKMGNERFAGYMKKMFDTKTGIDLPNETGNMISNLDSKRNIEFATASFGQGIAMTPISTIRALASLSNGGYLVEPHLVSSVEYIGGISKKIEHPKPIQIFSNQTSETISRMLVKVVDNALLEGEISDPYHTIAAKTGTAQIARTDGPGYYDDRYLHSFFGYFPAYDPKFIVFLFSVEPQNAGFAADSLARPFGSISKYLIDYYEIPPDRQPIENKDEKNN